jgi:ketosteroid isomerase-like protein
VSRENVDIVKRAFDAIARNDLEALLPMYDRDVEFLPLTGTRVESGGYRGHAGMRDYFHEAADVWDQLRPYAVDVRTVGDDVVVLGGCAVRGKASEIETDTPMAWVMTIRGGKITSSRAYATSAEALDAAGLSSDGRAT